MGAIGAAIATLTSQIVAAYLALAIAKDTRRIFAMESRAILMRT